MSAAEWDAEQLGYGGLCPGLELVGGEHSAILEARTFGGSFVHGSPLFEFSIKTVNVRVGKINDTEEKEDESGRVTLPACPLIKIK